MALTALVYQRTSSPLLSALTFAISYLPWLLGGTLLSVLADRLPRHRVLIVSDAVRAVLLVLMAIPGTPLPVQLALLFLMAICGPPFESARSALIADVLEGDRYAVANSLNNVSLQLAQVAGFAAAGALVALANPSTALIVDAGLFAVSALWLAVGLQRRAAPLAAAAAASQSLWRDAGDGLRLIAGSARLRAIVGLLWIGTLFVFAWEGIAAPLVAELGRGSSALGVLLAASPLGMTVGGLALARLVAPRHREELVPWLVGTSLLAVLAAGLVAAVAPPSPAAFGVVVVLFFLAGLGASWVIPLNLAFVQTVPSSYRGRAFGVAVSGLYGVQGLGALLAGAAAEQLMPSGVVMVSAGLGLLAVAPVLVVFGRTRGPVPGAGAGEGRSEA